MRRLALIALAVLLLAGAFGLGLATGMRESPSALYATIVETVNGESPQAKLDAYVHAIVRGDAPAARAAWELPENELSGGRSLELAARRDAVTESLVRAKISPSFQILTVQWWGTCCEPRVISNPRDAGGARVDVQFLDPAGNPMVYRFDVFTRGGPYWADAEGYEPRQWALRDVYRLEDEPLYWRLTGESSTRWLGE